MSESSKRVFSEGESTTTSMSPAEVAISVGVSKATVLTAIRNEELKCWRPTPRIIRIEPEQVEAWKNRMSNTKPKRTTAARLRAVE